MDWSRSKKHKAVYKLTESVDAPQFEATEDALLKLPGLHKLLDGTDRDIDRVRQRYMQLTKPELVELIIRMEPYISHQNQIWLKNEFKKFK